MDWFELPKKGTLETFTTAMYAPFGFRSRRALHHGVVDFGGGIKAFARLAKDFSEPKIGMDVTVRPLKYDDGQITFEITKA